MNDIIWNGQELERQITEQAGKALFAVALRVEALAKINITTNDQVDTGFMLNAVYALDKNNRNFAPMAPKKKGQQLADLPSVNEDLTAIVGDAAIYSIYQERLRAFLYPALQQVVGEVGGIFQEHVNL